MSQDSLSGALPKHLQLREILLDLIDTLQVEQPIPSERELAQRYGVARMTVRQAVESLVAEGRLFKVTGKGTFVAAPKLDLQARLTTFGEEMTRRGMRPSSTVLAYAKIKANAHLARELGASVGEDLVHLHRLRFADDVPMSVERTWLPAKLVPGLAEQPAPESLYATLTDQFGLTPDWGEDVIEAGIADQELANYLCVRQGAPLLYIERHTYAGQTLVSYSVSCYRSDRYQLWVPLARPVPPIHNPLHHPRK